MNPVRVLIEAISQGHSRSDTGRKFGIKPTRVSQLTARGYKHIKQALQPIHTGTA